MRNLLNPRLSNYGRNREYYEYWYKERAIPNPNPDHYNGHVYKLGKYEYPGLWLAYYATARHVFNCMACAADYANYKTDLLLPFPSTHKWEYKLLASHAKMVTESGHKVIREGMPV